MKIFISWSGNRSRAVAELLNVWVKCVLQASQPWISTRHIDRGSIWFSEINEQLQDVTIGIVCLTQENKNKPWILFECGALAKGLSTNRVCTLLVDLGSGDITDPLAQFNHTLPNETGMKELVITINAALGEQALSESVLSNVFKTYWPQFEAGFADILQQYPPENEVPPLSERELLSEILSVTRSNSNRLAALESRRGTGKSFEAPVNLSISTPDRVSDTVVDMLIGGQSDSEIVAHLAALNLSAAAIKNIINKARQTYFLYQKKVD